MGFVEVMRTPFLLGVSVLVGVCMVGLATRTSTPPSRWLVSMLTVGSLCAALSMAMTQEEAERWIHLLPTWGLAFASGGLWRATTAAAQRNDDTAGERRATHASPLPMPSPDGSEGRNVPRVP